MIDGCDWQTIPCTTPYSTHYNGIQGLRVSPQHRAYTLLPHAVTATRPPPMARRPTDPPVHAPVLSNRRRLHYSYEDEPTPMNVALRHMYMMNQHHDYVINRLSPWVRSAQLIGLDPSLPVHDSCWTVGSPLVAPPGVVSRTNYETITPTHIPTSALTDNVPPCTTRTDSHTH